MQTRVENFSVKVGARGVPSYSIELWHDGLKKHRIIRGDSESVVQMKATLQVEEWDAKWGIQDAKLKEKLNKAEAKRIQDEKTNAAKIELERLDGLLKETLQVNDAINWDNLKDKSNFPEEKPVKPQSPNYPTEPNQNSEDYTLSFGFIDKIIKSRKVRKIEEKKSQYAKDHQLWKEQIEKINKKHFLENSIYEKHFLQWSIKKEEYIKKQIEQHAAIELKKKSYEEKDKNAIVDYCDMVLSFSNYPNYFPQEFDIDFSAETLVIDYRLPSPDDIPKLKSVKYVASREEFEEQFITDVQASKMYDDVLYQIVLRTIHEIFEADLVLAIEAIVFNGIVTAIDKATGKSVTSCVLSLRANREEFLQINLGQVDPKKCFKALKGVGSSKLHGLAPVAPIMQLRRDDGRFVSAYEVANTLDESVNIAAIGWEDFEHLIREIFEKEFSSSGGEVKVTQASRDGGVDAVAFDPDPIRGGKIVIQAKRYTNTVGVGAVRDLYGTVLNEGATKGVLVTTSDYGPDSYTFANGKPLVLLNGSNLLHMLEKHGHKAKIDLQEAKRISASIAEQSNKSAQWRT